jgi:hypothetical protein
VVISSCTKGIFSICTNCSYIMSSSCITAVHSCNVYQVQIQILCKSFLVTIFHNRPRSCESPFIPLSYSLGSKSCITCMIIFGHILIYLSNNHTIVFL